MPIATATALGDEIRRHRLLPESRLAELSGLATRIPDPRNLARELVKRGWLTPYQVNQLLLGRGAELVLGPYVLLDRLGEGGMGQVLKARHQRLDRTVALKVIRTARLSHPDAVERFQREAKAVARLTHPNIVTIYDADEVHGTHFYAMEFVEGIDLAKLVQVRGPLPVAEACEYIRQTALGLQHAHEHGLVHRDIKPANLIVTSGQWPVVSEKQKAASPLATDHRPLTTLKILDLGLARLKGAADERGKETDALTREGTVMGTPD